MKPSSALKQIRLLAAMGLGGHIAIPEMLDLLGHVLPGAFNNFFWLTADGEVTDAVVPYLIPNALQALATLPADEPSFARILAVGNTVGSTLKLHASHDYSRSILCNEVWRPYGIGCGLDVVLREGGRARGVLYVNREPRQSRFSASDFRVLDAIAPHFLHALSDCGDRDAAIDPTEQRSAAFLVATDGTLLSASDEAMHLLLLMAGAALVHSEGQRSLSPVRAIIGELTRRQATVRAGRPGPPARMERVTRWGRYRARAFPQRRPDGTSSDTLVVQISEHLPVAIRLARRVADLDLSPREREVALLIATGGDPAAAGASLGISISTWRSYVKRIYQRLDVSSRDEFHALLHGTGERLQRHGA